jgi:hypothetical protein
VCVVSISLLNQVPASTVVSMVVRSEEQLRYLVLTEDENSLRVLLFDDDITEALGIVGDQIRTCRFKIMGLVLLKVTMTSKDLAWLKVPCKYATLVDDSTAVLKQLQLLDLQYCVRIPEVAGTGLANLQYLHLDGCYSLTAVQGLRELTALKYLNMSKTKTTAAALAGLCALTELQHLTATECSGLTDLPQLRSLENLTHLELRGCQQLTILSALESLVSLQRLELRDCAGVATLDVTGLTSLQFLGLSGCCHLSTLTGIDTLTDLQQLDLRLCKSLCGKLNLTGLVHLQLLDLNDCCHVADVQGIDTLVSLRSLSLHKLSTPLDLTKLAALTYVSLKGCSVLPAGEAAGITRAALHTLEINNLSTLNYFQTQHLPAIHELTIVGSGSILTLDCSSWSSLTLLTVEHCDNLTALQGLDKLRVLEKLDINQCSQLEHISELACSKTLKSLKLMRCPKLRSIHNDFTDFGVLNYLSVFGCGSDGSLASSTGKSLVEQVSALRQRPGSYYYRGHMLVPDKSLT